MAKNNQPVEETAIDNLNSRLTNAGQKVADNKKIIYWVVGAIVAVGLFICAWLWFFHNPRIEKSFEAYTKVETTALGNDSVAAAGYKAVADKFSGDAANLAALEAAEHFYNLGKYDEAIKYVQKFSTSDDVLMANAQALEGDCYVNQKKYDQALACFDKAISTCDKNPQIAPRVLLKKAVVYDELKQYDKALQCYETIKNEYPRFELGGRNGVTIDSYIARENARLGK